MQKALVIRLSLDSSMDKFGVILQEKELAWAEPAEDGPAALINTPDVSTGWFFCMEGG